jgi:hypothetical protein
VSEERHDLHALANVITIIKFKTSPHFIETHVSF